MIEKMYDGPYLELFASTRAEGWAVYGEAQAEEPTPEEPTPEEKHEQDVAEWESWDGRPP